MFFVKKVLQHKCWHPDWGVVEHLLNLSDIAALFDVHQKKARALMVSASIEPSDGERGLHVYPAHRVLELLPPHLRERRFSYVKLCRAVRIIGSTNGTLFKWVQLGVVSRVKINGLFEARYIREELLEAVRVPLNAPRRIRASTLVRRTGLEGWLLQSWIEEGKLDLLRGQAWEDDPHVSVLSVRACLVRELYI